LSSRTAREKISDTTWNGIIEKLTASVTTAGIRNACIDAIHQMAGLLTAQFPKI
jgi:uncharacterized membrane protein